MQINTEQVLNVVLDYGIRIVAALVIFIVGKWIAKWIAATVRKAMERHKTDPVLVSFLSNMLYYLLIVVVVIAAIGRLGVQTTSLVAVLGAAGLAVGLALQGSLSNFAAGVLIILFRPFKIGDFVEVGGTAGIIEEIGILTTHMRTPDNKAIIVPNSNVMGQNITNFSAKDTRRVDLVFGISYGDDVVKAKAVLTDVVNSHPLVLKDPAPTIGVVALADSSVNFAVRPWVKASDYWTVYFDLHEQVKVRLDKEGITIPFPQRDVHIHQSK